MNIGQTTTPFPSSDELRLARAVQARTFPEKIARVPGYEIFGRARPAGWGSGDFFDAMGVAPRADGQGFRHDPSPAVEHLVLALGDATGHGLASALIATELRALLRASIRLGVYHRDLVEMLNEQLSEDLSAEHFATLLMGRLERAKNTFHWVSLGQSPVWLYRAATGVVEDLAPHNPPLGVLPVVPRYEPTETLLEPGDALLALSDGFPESMDASGNLLGEAPLKNLFRLHAADTPETMHDAMTRLAESHAAGLPQRDDRTFLLIRRLR